MSFEIKNAKGIADKIQRSNALETLEQNCSTSQLKKFAELSSLEGAPKKFEENFEMLKGFL